MDVGAERGRWLSYAEVAEIRGADRESIIRLARRKRWPKQASNDGSTRILVPPEFLEGRNPQARKDIRQDPREDDLSHKIMGLAAQLADAREQIGQVTGQLTSTREELERERAQNRDLQEQNATLREARAVAEALANERAAALAWLTRRRWWQLRRKPRD